MLKSVTLSSLLPAEGDEIRMFVLVLKTVLFLFHKISGTGLPTAVHDTTNTSPNTISRPDLGNAVNCGGTRGIEVD